LLASDFNDESTQLYFITNLVKTRLLTLYVLIDECWRHAYPGFA